MKCSRLGFLLCLLGEYRHTTTLAFQFHGPVHHHHSHWHSNNNRLSNPLHHHHHHPSRLVKSPLSVIVESSLSSSSSSTRLKSSASSSTTTTTTPQNQNQNQTGWKQKVKTILSGPNPQRPDWALDWMPTWLTSLRPTTQLVAALLLYIFHLTVLTQTSIPFPFQLIPNEKGHFQSMGLDSLAGILTLAAYQYFRRPVSKEVEQEDGTVQNKIIKLSSLPPLLSTPKLKESPWKNIYKSKYSRFSSFLGLCALFQAYFWMGRLSVFWEDFFYDLANYLPITVAMHRSLCVLFGHLGWIGLGGSILRLIPRPQNFFNGNTWYKQQLYYEEKKKEEEKEEVTTTKTTTETTTMETTEAQQEGDEKGDDPADAVSTTTTATTRPTQWLWWAIGGYFVSSWFFNIADFCNQWLLPVAVLEQAQNSVVSQLVTPENNDWLASFVGFIAPCLTAPWWEEVLYRGFLLPALILNMRYKWAVLMSGLIFSIHHMSATSFIPLTILGWTWSILYAKSDNLWTTILVHAMWNTRIFVGSWLGL